MSYTYQCSLTPSPPPKAMVLRPKVAPFGTHRPMRCLHQYLQYLFEPRATFACAATPPLTSTLIVASTYASPRCQVSGTGKAAHVSAHLSHQHLSNTLRDPTHTIQQFQHLHLPFAHERAALLLDLSAHSLDRGVQMVNVSQVFGYHEAVERAHSTPKSRQERITLLSQSSFGKVGQHSRIALPRKQRLQHGASRHAHYVSGYPCQLDVGVFQHLTLCNLLMVSARSLTRVVR